MKKNSKKITLAFDARMIHHSGIGTQVYNTLKYLTREESLDLTLLGNESEIHESLPDFTGNIIPFNAGIYSLNEQLFFPKIQENAILHIPHYNVPMFHLKNSVVMVHDLIHLQSDEFALPHYRLYATLLLSVAIKKAKRILTVSETTRQELLMRFPKVESKTTVVYNGLDHDLYKPQSEESIKDFKAKYNLPKKFLLVVGIGKKHKNVDMLIRALSSLWKEKKLTHPLVLGGSGGSIPEYVRQAIDKNDVAPYVIPMPRIDLQEMPLLYGSSDIFIMPSLLEGFGFPVVEAMASGTPVLCSNASCLPEVAGNGAVFFDPKNPTDFVKKLMLFLENPSKRKEYVGKGISRARFFSWKKHASEIIQVYNAIG